MKKFKIQNTYICVWKEGSIAILLEYLLQVVPRVWLIVYQLRIMIVVGRSRIVLVMVVVYEKEDSHITEEGELHGFL